MEVVISAIILLVIPLALASLLKAVLVHQPKKIREKYQNEHAASILQKKYAEADFRRYRGTFMRLGLVIALGLVLFGLESYKSKDRISDYGRKPITPDEVTIQIQIPPKKKEVHKLVIKQEEQATRKEVSKVVEVPKVELTPIRKPVPKQLPAVKNGEKQNKPAPSKVPANNFKTGKGKEKALPIPTPKVDKNKIESFVDHAPEYKGGVNALRKEIARKYRVPSRYKKNGKRAQLVTRFVVERDGSIGQVEILKPIEECAKCSEEAKRVLKRLKHKFSPGIQAGQPVRVWFTLPIVIEIK